MTAVMEAHVENLKNGKLIGERFGKYLLIGEIATGGMAEIFLAVNKGLEGFVKVVVIKRVLQHLTRNADFVQMFINEARLVARLEHSNIVRTYEFGEVDGQYYTAMEYLPGEDLFKVLNNLSISKQLMPPSLAAGIVVQLCTGLHFAHQLTDTDGRPLNLVHRDINPANVVITYNGEVKVIDFGVAKSDVNQKTMTGTIKGKIAYMPPEQVLGHVVDQRADIFSTGVVLWELLTGRPLFLRSNEAATLQAVMNAPITSPDMIRPEIPPQLGGITMRALARSPADRFETAEQMALELETAMARMSPFNPRVLAGALEGLFGSTRAEAKRAIAQTRSLTQNISLVMKLRSEVRADLVERLDAATVRGSRTDQVGLGHADPAPARTPAQRSRLQRNTLLALAAVLLACIAAWLGHALLRPTSQPIVAAVVQTALQIDSTPAGAAVFVASEPTGLKTPTRLTGITGDELAIRLELPGHAPATEQVRVRAGATTSKHIALTPLPGRLVLSGLPANATVIVDGEEHAAGEVITVARGGHDVRVVLDGKTIAERTITSTAGDQGWRLVNGALVSN